MTLSGLLNDQVTRLRALFVADAYGNQVPDWENAATLDLPARVQQTAAAEDTADRDQQTAQFVIFLPSTADVSGSDRLVWQDRTFELVGPPDRVGGFTGTHHVEARAREVTG